MERECDIVKDLLFSYNDGVLSNASKELVDNHMKTCNKCPDVLQEIKDEHIEKSEKKEIDYLKKIRKKINRKTIYICVVAILLFVIMAFNVLVMRLYNDMARTMEIYLTKDITDEQLSDIKETIQYIADNSMIAYFSSEFNFGQMRMALGEREDLLEDIDIAVIPASLSVATNSVECIRKVKSTVMRMSGVQHINAHFDENPYLMFFAKVFRQLQ